MNALLIAALATGFAGSAHCLGMCGPIALAVPVMGQGRGARWLGTALLNGGRLTTYALLGAAFGAFGQGLRLAGLQQGVSLFAGIVLLGSVLAPGLLERWSGQGRLAVLIGRVRSMMGRHLRRTAPEAIFLTGMLNGLLPCGLVYASAIGASAMGSLGGGVAFMLVFGAGTLPALVAVREFGGQLGTRYRGQLRRFAPVVVGAMGLLLILRGSRLDIPYLSPSAPSTPAAVTACH